MKKKFVSLVLAVSLVLSIVPITAIAALSYSDYSAIPIDSYKSFRNHVLGKAYNTDGAHGAQCWDGANILWLRATERRLLTKSGGGCARDCWNVSRIDNAGTEFELITDINSVQQGDVVVFDGGNNGHIAFADEDYNGSGKLNILGQNQGNNRTPVYDSCGCYESAFNIFLRSTSDFIGAFRYKEWGDDECPKDDECPEIKSIDEITDADLTGFTVNFTATDNRTISKVYAKVWGCNQTKSEAKRINGSYNSDTNKGTIRVNLSGGENCFKHYAEYYFVVIYVVDGAGNYTCNPVENLEKQNDSEGLPVSIIRLNEADSGEYRAKTNTYGYAAPATELFGNNTKCKDISSGEKLEVLGGYYNNVDSCEYLCVNIGSNYTHLFVKKSDFEPITELSTALKEFTIIGGQKVYAATGIGRYIFGKSGYGKESYISKYYFGNDDADAVYYVNSGNISDSVNWALYSDGALYISGNGVIPNYGIKLVKELSPWWYNKQQITRVILSEGITEIGNNAFYECNNIESVDLGDSLVSIGTSAFLHCNLITSITFPNSLTNIGSSAFNGCSLLENITIPESVEVVGSSSFGGCSALKRVTFLGNTGSLNIEESAFANCTSLEDVSFSDKTISIQYCAFENCTGLHQFTIPKNVIYRGYGIFTGCNNIETLTLSAFTPTDTDISNKASERYIDFLFGNTNAGSNPQPPTSLKTVIVADDCEKINYRALYYCSNIENVIIGNSVKEIDESAFAGCTSLKTVTISNSVKNIGTGAFSGCASLSSVSCKGTETIGNSAFNGCSSITSVVLGESLTNIGDFAFKDCSSIKNITLPNSLTNIGSSAFNGCSLLENITIPESVEVVGSSSFGGCSALKQVTFLGNTGSLNIEESTFANCTSLEDVSFSDKSISIQGYAFKNCTGLHQFTIPKNVIYRGYGIFTGCNNIETLTLSAFTPTDTDTSKTASKYYVQYLFNGSPSGIPSSLKTIIIADDCEKILCGAFYNCSNVENVIIGNSVKEINESAFSNCIGLKDVYYHGTKGEWDSITIYADNTPLTNANLHFTGTDCPHTNISTVAAMNSTCQEQGHNEYVVCNDCHQIISGSDEKLPLGEHIGGTATCIQKAKCEVCGVEYGDYAAHKLTQHERVEPTFENDGNIEYWSCDDCDKYFSDEEGKFEISIEATIIEKVEVNNKCGENIVWGFDDETGTLFITGTGDMYDYYLDMFYNKYTTPWEDYKKVIRKVLVDDGVSSIGDYAFADCNNMLEAVLSDSVLSIGEGAFLDCSSLSFLEGGSCVSNIRQYAFCDCYSLQEFSIPDGVKNIERSTFNSCNNLTKIVLPNSIVSIDNYAFTYCDKLESVYYSGTNEDRERIIIADGNDNIENANWIYAKAVKTFIDGEVLIDIPTNTIPENAEFAVEKIVPPPEEIVEKVKDTYGESSEVLAYYEIRLFDENGEQVYNLDNEITIKTKLPEKYQSGYIIKVCQENDNGILIEMESWREGEYICYKTDWLEKY